MSGSAEFDFIIVGQGLAGSILTLELLNAGCRLAVFDNPGANSSSMVAAGLFNPVTGRRFAETWMAEPLFTYLFEYYDKLEKRLGIKCFYPMPMFRPFLPADDSDGILNRIRQAPYFESHLEKSYEQKVFFNRYGGIFLRRTGYVDVPRLLEAIRNRVSPETDYASEIFEHDKLEIKPGYIKYGGIRADRIIFCEGHSATMNPFFQWIPFRPVKGEILHIMPEREPRYIFNRQVFIIPWHDASCRVGATYDRDISNPEPTEKAKKYLLDKLNLYFTVNYTIKDHVAGIRPATADRRPVMGMHPVHSRLGIFNGLGSKGVSLAPYFAGLFVDYLLNNMELIKEVNIKRFY